MDIERLRRFLAGVDTSLVDDIEMKLVQKIRNDIIVHQPQLTEAMRIDLKNFYIDVLNNPFYNLNQMDYNPNVVVDGTLQVSDLETAHINQVLDDINNEENINDDMEELDIDNINYYCFKMKINDNVAYLFRRSTKMKKIRNGILGFFRDNTFRKIEADKFFGIDKDIDILIFEGEALIINRFALQTIFRLNDYFNQQATIALNILNDYNILENFDDFFNDCINDKLAARRMTKILNTDGRIDGFVQNIHQLNNVINQFDLEIELNNNNQIVYNRTKEARSQILFCISDAYYQSLILQRLGEDIS